MIELREKESINLSSAYNADPLILNDPSFLCLFVISVIIVTSFSSSNNSSFLICSW